MAARTPSWAAAAPHNHLFHNPAVTRCDEGQPVKVTVDQDRCVAAGQCAAAAPDVFDQRDEDGVVVLLTDAPSAALAGDVRQAAAVCPALAIHIKE